VTGRTLSAAVLRYNYCVSASHIVMLCTFLWNK